MWIRIGILVVFGSTVCCNRSVRPVPNPCPKPVAVGVGNPTSLTKNSRSSDLRRDVHTKASHVINVLNRGVKGDGITDDTDSLEQILFLVKPGQVVYFPEGTYRISRPLLLQTDRVRISGESVEKTTLLFDNSDDFHRKYGKRVGMLNLYANDLKVSGLTFDQNFRNSQRSRQDKALISCIQGGGAYLGKTKKLERIEISHCRFYDFFGDALGFFNAGASEIHIHHNLFISSFIVQEWPEYYLGGEQSISIGWAINCTIEDNVIEGALDDAIAIHNKSKNVLVRRNRITTAAGRILICGTSGGIVEDNTIEVIEDADCAIFVSFAASGRNITFNHCIEVRDNTIKVKPGVKCNFGIRLFGAGDNIEVVDNKIDFTTEAGIGIAISDRKHKVEQQFYAGSNIWITSNEIQNARIGIQETTIRALYNNIYISKNKIINSEIGINARPGNIQNDNVFKMVKRPTTNNSHFGFSSPSKTN